MKTFLVTIALALAVSAPTFAGDFKRIKDEATFRSHVVDKRITSDGGHFTLHSDGNVTGKFKTRPIVGRWIWDKEFWCRNLNVAGKISGTNCQVVKISGNQLKFIRDKGKGDDSAVYLLN